MIVIVTQRQNPNSHRRFFTSIDHILFDSSSFYLHNPPCAMDCTSEVQNQEWCVPMPLPPNLLSLPFLNNCLPAKVISGARFCIVILPLYSHITLLCCNPCPTRHHRRRLYVDVKCRTASDSADVQRTVDCLDALICLVSTSNRRGGLDASCFNHIFVNVLLFFPQVVGHNRTA